MRRAVTERDFRRPEFRDAAPEDYEFRDDGAIVRKDRWEMGVRRIAGIMGLSRSAFEIDEVVEAVSHLRGDEWLRVDVLEEEIPADIKLQDGSLLCGAIFRGHVYGWQWNGVQVTPERVIGWRAHVPASPE